MIVLNSAHHKPSVTPVGGSASLATAPARHAMDLGQLTVTCVLVGTPLYMASALWLTAHWDNTLQVRGTSIIRLNCLMVMFVIFL